MSIEVLHAFLAAAFAWVGAITVFYICDWLKERKRLRLLTLRDIVTTTLQNRHKEIARNIMEGNALLDKMDPRMLSRWNTSYVATNNKAHTLILTLFSHYQKYAGDKACDYRGFLTYLIEEKGHTVRNGRVLRTQLIR